MEIENLIKWVGIGVVGYFVARELGVFGDGQTQGRVQGGGDGTGLPSAQELSSALKQSVLAKASTLGEYANGGGKLGFDQWNWVLANVDSTAPIKSWEDTQASVNDRSKLYTIDEFWGFVNNSGLGGMGGVFNRNVSLWEQKVRSGGGARRGEVVTAFMQRRVM